MKTFLRIALAALLVSCAHAQTRIEKRGKNGPLSDLSNPITIGNNQKIIVESGGEIQMDPGALFDYTITDASLPDVVTAGSFTSVNVTVDAKGRIVAIENGSGLSDGDKGEITVSGSGANFLIDAAAITAEKIAAALKPSGTAAAGDEALRALGTGANNAAAGNDTRITGAVPNTRTVNGQALSGDITLTKTDLSLGNVDNTADASKPVSTAQQAALDLKSGLLSVASLGSTELAFAPFPHPVKTVTWDGTPVTLTYTGGTDAAGDGQMVVATVTAATAVTITPTSADVYRNGNETALGATVTTYTEGRHYLHFWTSDTGSTVLLDDTLVTASDIQIADTGTYFTTDNVESALQESAASISGKIDTSYLDTDVDLAANSDVKIATQKAVKAYVDASIVTGSVSDIAYDEATFDGVNDVAPSKNVFRDTIESLSAGTLFTVKMGTLWPTADLASKPAGWLTAGEGGTAAGATVGDYSIIVKSAGDVAAPTFSPVEGTYGSSQNMTLSSTTPDAIIKFTTNGTDPSRDDGATYSTPFSIEETTTVKAIAYKDTYADSAVTQAVITIEEASLALSSAEIASDGGSITLTFSESVSVGAGGNGGLAATVNAGAAGTSPGAVTLTYASGAPGTALVYTTSRTVNPSAVETLELAYTQPGNGLEATTGGTDLTAFSGTATTNSSTTQTYTLQETIGSSAANISLNDASTNVWVASKRTAAASYILTRMDVNMLRVNNPTTVVNVKILSDSAGIPGSILTTSTNTITGSDVLTTESFIPFYFAGYSITSSAIYWLTPNANAFTGATNYYRLRAGAGATGDLDASADGVTWAGYNNRPTNIRTYSSP